MKILFFLRHHGYLRMYESTLRLLLQRGHRVAVVFEVRKPVPIAEALAAEHETFSYTFADPGKRNDAREVAMRIRTAGDYLRYLEPVYRESPRLRSRVEKRAPKGFLRLLDFPLVNTRLGRAALRTALRLADASFPSIPEVDALIRRHAPDIVLVTPLIDIPSPQNEYIRSAKALGIPTGLCVNSWDNLTNKGVIWELPDRVYLWNAAQKAEAVELHGVPAARVVVTGAQAFDKWFSARPTLDRPGFAQKVGLPDERPFVLYVGSSAFIAAGDERRFVERWIRSLRESNDRVLADVGIVVRPHPGNLAEWSGFDPRGADGVVRWPPPGATPIDADWAADYKDSLIHCSAVVGINTSALIEAGIVGKGVYTILAPEFADTQEGTLHFRHLLRAQGGLLEVANGLEEHAAQLGAGLRDESEAAAHSRRFVESFVRPLGMDRDATPILADAIEALRTEPRPARSLVQQLTRPLGRFLAIRFAGMMGSRIGTAPRKDGTRSILFVMRHAGYVRNFESTIRLLATRGHRVHLAFEKGKGKKDVVLQDSLAESIADEYPNVTIGPVPVREDDEWAPLARATRQAANYLRYLTPAYDKANKLRARAESKAVDEVRRLAEMPLIRTRPGRRMLAGALRAIERAIPRSPAIDKFMREQRPDIMLVTPLVEFGSTQSDYVVSARAAGIRTLLCVYSWDNLTNKGLIRDKPDTVAVWNEAQRREAVKFHGVPPENVVVTGAPIFDQWFTWEPSRSRDEFVQMVGLPSDRTTLLYLCSSPFIAPDETGFVREWIRQLRNCDDEALRTSAVLIRPHPQNAEQWRDADLSGLGAVAVYPRGGADPVDKQTRRDFFDSMYYCQAVVGINTSALIESAIVNRPVFTILAPEFRETQEGTLHFHHLARDDGGLLHVAEGYEQHIAQLSAALLDPTATRKRNATFLRKFVRPAGLEQPATPALVDAIEKACAQPAPRPRTAGWPFELVRWLVRPVALRARSRVIAIKNKKAKSSRDRSEPGRRVGVGSAASGRSGATT